MDRVLIASGNEKATAMLVSLLKENCPSCNISIAVADSEARRTASSGEYDAVIINSPLKDDYGLELAQMISEDTNSSCIFIAKAANVDAVWDRLEDYGVQIIEKPLSRHSFYRAIKFADASRRRMFGLQTENIKLHKKLEEIKMINRAKFVLMQYLSFTEQQAHRYLEKQAMDLRCTKLEVAKKVIKMYEV